VAARQEPGAGSDARNNRTSAREDGGDYVNNGEKTLITRGNDADFVMVFAVVPDKGITCVLVDRAQGFPPAWPVPPGLGWQVLRRKGRP
jgi:acyl-CoA dehydrogenase